MSFSFDENTETTIKARSAASGISIGPALVIKAGSQKISPTAITESEIEAHKEKFCSARASLVQELEKMSGGLQDKSTAEIIEAQQQIIEDPEIKRTVFEIVEKKLLSVDFAVYETFSSFIEQLKESGSELFRQRIIDLEDIRDRYVSKVCDHATELKVPEGAILVASKISPTELVNYYEEGAGGLVLEKGGITSHAVIIAKSLGIPCLINADKATKVVSSNEMVILDADKGGLILDPSDEVLKEYAEKLKGAQVSVKADRAAGFETKDGFPFKLMANVEFEAELPRVSEMKSQGIGLLRTESLLFGKKLRKDVEDQEAFYTAMLENSEGPVTIRLFDIGGDKNARRPYKEANPFLGWRGIRLLLDEKKLLRSQLKAILTIAGKYTGRVKLLIPMISVVDEIDQIRDEIEKMQGALLSSGTPIDEDLPIGIMVEVPSVALSAFHFAKKVDFLSIGSNDLTQYTLAVDRGNEKIHTLFQHYHPAVLKLIKMTVKGAEKAGTNVSVCGELAGDEIGAACLMGFGINELSMVPNSLPAIYDLLSSRNKKDFDELAEKAVDLSSSEELEQLFREWKDQTA
ncbi:phosphoenolpyruvate--protein phosphotransferase [Gracilimonas amylolytica]|uniref:phosphoenolpyruvate--protein phosphotransferase n=1 Tax=Gracilimonas amylolytica TaxID=1749045 RepID=UPI000CD8220B|nr:phosphoenolpyruvate--protein phosphotransferase [Gracilimonas amylolytica]